MPSKPYQLPEYKLTTVKLHEVPTRSADRPEHFLTLWRDVVTTCDWYDDEREHVVVFALNSRLNLKGFFLIGVGSINECTCHPREVFRPLVNCAAAGFVLMHNHPSGDPSPSDADRRLTRRLTRRLKEAGEMLGINLLDHVIAGDTHFSFRESGMI
jgi:DNA repair protein RadC